MFFASVPCFLPPFDFAPPCLLLFFRLDAVFPRPPPPMASAFMAAAISLSPDSESNETPLSSSIASFSSC